MYRHLEACWEQFFQSLNPIENELLSEPSLTELNYSRQLKVVLRKRFMSIDFI